MIDEVANGIYRLEIPLPIPVVGSMNCYVIMDTERSLVIDPGMAHEMCHTALMTGLDAIGVDLERSDFLITHHHLDHFGLLSRILTKSSVIYASAIEAGIVERISSGEILPILSNLLRLMGFPEEDPRKALSELLGDEYKALNRWPFRHLSDASVVTRGGHNLRCILTPGHSAGHVCLYEAGSRLLIGGDAFSPVLQFFSDGESPLPAQYATLRRLDLLDVRMVLPGHRSVFGDMNKTTEQLKAHHALRNESILEALADTSMDAYQVAIRLAPGTQTPGPWGDLPNVLKFIATRDCLAHLLYLETEGRVTKKAVGGRMVYSLASLPPPS